MSEVFQRLLNLSIKRHLPLQVQLGKVEAVDSDTQTCTIVRDDAPKLFGVRFNATVAGYNDRIILKPKCDSIVLVAIIENDENEAYLLACSELEEVSITIEDQSVLMNKDGFVFNNGEAGGLIIVEELQTQLAKLTNRVDGIIDSLKTSMPGSADGGAQYKGQIVGKLANLTDVEDFSNIENMKVKHGPK